MFSDTASQGMSMHSSISFARCIPATRPPSPKPLRKGSKYGNGGTAQVVRRAGGGSPTSRGDPPQQPPILYEQKLQFLSKTTHDSFTEESPILIKKTYRFCDKKINNSYRKTSRVFPKKKPTGH